jgi:RNase P/RNase MRP subunit p29
MIGLGALTAGGSAAFGTEAFTSVEAERNVDVTVAGDQSAFVAIEPLSGDNAGKYVSRENDQTIAVNLDDDSGGLGEGVSQDAVTEIDDLFRIVNQGSQPSNVYFEDSSDAVTFRVTNSPGTNTSGVRGESLDGSQNAVELAVGQQVVVGLTIDTASNDVSGDLLGSDVTLHADSVDDVPQQAVPEPDIVVDGDGADDETFADLSSAINSADIQTGTVVGIEGDLSVEESSGITISTDDVTVAGLNGQPTIEYVGGYGSSPITVDGNGVSIQNVQFDFFGNSDDDSLTNFGGGASSFVETGSNVTFRNSAFNVILVESNGDVTFDTKGGLALGDTEGASFIGTEISILNRQSGAPISSERGRPGGFFVVGREIRNCTLRGGPKIATGGNTTATITDNFITDTGSTEGIAIDSAAKDVTVEGNLISYDASDQNISTPFNGAEIRVEPGPAQVNVNDGAGNGDAGDQATELSQTNSGSQPEADGDAVVVNRSTDPNTFVPSSFSPE